MSCFKNTEEKSGLKSWAGLSLSLALAAAFAALFIHARPPRTIAAVIPPPADSVEDGESWHTACNGVQCELCPFRCFLPEGAVGKCRLRVNHGGALKLSSSAGELKK